MKSKLLLLYFLFLNFILFSQTTQEKNIILKETNVSKLLKFSNLKTIKSIEDKNLALSMAKIKDWQVFIKESNGRFSELIKVDSNGNPVYYSTYNYGAGLTARTNHLYSGGSLGLNIEGQNMIAGEWDGGGVLLTHELFEGRVTQMDGASSTHYHSTHVAGTIMGTDQVQGGNARGMAFKANLHAYEWNSDQAEVATAAANGLLISNHSYGHNPAYLSLHQFGKYEADANAFDDIMYNAPYYLFVAAAGNARDNGYNSGDGGYDLLSGHSCTKNSMIVAAVHELTNYTGASSVNMSYFSSWGPTDDGRIKPDISAKGVDTYSASDNSNSDYITISGTSMASPSVTGTLLLMQQYYNQQNGQFMHSSTLRGLALHTADEAGNNPGPDYEFGWGLINAKKAAEVIRDNGLLSYISEETLSQGSSYSISFDALGSEPLKASICWTDPAGTIITNTIEDFYSPALVNDLDIRITQNGTTYYPWKLDPNNLSGAAAKGDNVVDNIEQVAINNPVGSYTLTVTHKGTLQSGSQNFSVIVSGISFNDFYITSSNEKQNICEGDNTAQFNLDLATISGFSDTVNFSIINLPAGVNASFSPTSLNAAGSFTLDLTNLSSLTAGIYPFTIHGASNTDVADLDVELQVYGTSFTTQILNDPTDNATSIPIDATFSWEENTNAQQYFIQIATDDTFTNIIENGSVTSSSFQATTLDYNTTYYWRVQPTNICGDGTYSSIYSFTTVCLGPTNVTTSNVVLDSVDVSWTENSGGTNWEIEAVESGNSPTGIGISINTNPYTLNGLNSSTEYTVYVRSDCGSGNFSEWGVSSSFITAADFCSGDHFYDTGGASGSYSNGENYTTTIAPSIGNNTVMVTFNSFQLESGYDYLKVYDGSDTNATLLGIYSGSSIPGPFTSNNPNGTLTFWFTSDGSVTYSGWDATVDCINITCPQPSSFASQNISYNSLDLSWIAGDTETEWEIEYGLAGFTQGSGTLFQTASNPQSITGLNPNTTYDFYIRANCGANPGDDDSLWLGPITTTTLVSCPQPYNLYVNTTYNSAEVSWSSGGSETNWEIEYGLYGFTQGTGTLIQTSSNPYTITGLEDTTPYQVYVRANCGLNSGDDDSNWVGPYYFYTQNLPSPSNLIANLDQNTGSVTLNWDAANYNGSSDFETYYIYRDGALVATSVSETFIDTLPIYGNYYYYVKAKYNQGESYQTNTEYVLWESCPAPSNLIASNETTSSVDLAWDLGYSETAWEIEYGNYGFSQGTGTLVQANTNPFTLTGLNHSTKYDIYLRANCGTNPGDDDSNWVGPITFTTLCSTFTTPYLEDVEAFNGNYEIENCWSATPLVSSGNYAWNISSYGTTPSSSTGPSQANSGSTFFYTEASNGYTGNIAELVTPIIDISSLTVPQLSFYYHMYGYEMGSLHVDIFNNGNWTDDVIVIDGQQQVSGTSPWIEQTLVLNAYTGDIQIRFRGIRGNSYTSDIAIDDIQVVEAPTCPKPANLSETNITASTVDLFWTNGNTETNWEVEYGDTGYTQGTGTTVAVTTNPFTLTGLTAVTTYDLYLRAICGANPGDDDSTWVGPITFTTLCDVFNTPFVEDVEAFYGNYEIENCWSATPLVSSSNYAWNISSYGTTPSSNTGPSQANSGSTYFFTEASNGNSSDIAELVTPIIDISSLTVPQLSFYYHMYGYEMGSLHVDIFNNGNWTDDVIVIDGQQQVSGTSPWIEQTLVLNAYIGDIQIRFRGLRGNSYTSDMAIDDIQVIEAPTCPKPTDLTENNITASTVDLFWTNGNTETNWEIEYGDTGFTQGTGTTVAVTTNPFTLTGLITETTYDVYLRAVCGANSGDDDSIWTGPITFTTQALAKPYNLTADLDETNGEVTLNWDQVSGFHDDFNSATLWNSVTGNWNLNSGNYNVNSTVQASSSYYNQDFSNFEFEVKMRKTSGSDCNMSLYFNGDPSSLDSYGYWNNGYQVLYCTSSGSWILTKMVNGNWIMIKDWDISYDLNLGLNTWNTIKINVANGYIDVKFNGVLQGTYFDNTFTSGKVGLNMADSNNNGTAEYDYAYLTDLSTTYQFGTISQDANRNVYNSITCFDNNATPIRIEEAPIPISGNNYIYIANTTNAFQNYKIYRDGTEIDTSILETYLDQLPSYGDYQYYVTSIYDEGESLPSNTVNVSWHGTPNIVVNPLSLSQTLYTNENATQPITITNNGDDDLNFTINSSVVSTNYENIGFGNIETENLTPYTIENSAEEIIKTPTFSKRTYFNTTDTPNILIYEATSNHNYYTEALINLGYTFTQVSSWNDLEMAINDGTNWQLVIVNSYISVFYTGVLDTLNAYLLNGGFLIFADWDVYEYSSHSLLSNMGVNFISSIGNPINFSATDTSHPIFNSPNLISTFTWSDDQYSVDGQIVNMINGSTQLAAFDGYSTNGAIVLNANQNCIFNAFQSANFQNDDNANGKDDIQELLENEINYLIGNSWLSTTQTSGTVIAGSSVTIDVHFDSTDMTVGTYNGIVAISSNDPDEPVVNIAAELIVIDDTDSINELSQFNFKYYPNPFSNSINISANENFDSIKIYSLLGQELMEINPDNQSQLTIDVSKLSVGTYFMKVVIDGKISTLKIIKK